MCRAMGDMGNEAAYMAAQKKAVDIAAAMIASGKCALEEISALYGLSVEKDVWMIDVGLFLA